MTDTVLPTEISAEKAVLGAILLDPDVFYDVSEKLTEIDFYNAFNQNAFKAMCALINSERPIDPIELEKEIHKIGDKRTTGVDVLTELCSIQDVTPTSKNVMLYVDLVLTSSIKRKSIKIGNELIFEATSKELEIVDVVDGATEKLGKLLESNATSESMLGIDEALERTVDRIEELANSKDPNRLLGVTTGFSDLDKMTSGLVAGDLIIVAARPSMGKTTFALNLAESSMAANPLPTIVFSVEMPTDQIMQKFICSIGSLELNKLRTGDLDDGDWGRISHAMGELKTQGNLHIDDASGISVAEVRAKSRKIARKHGGVSMIMIDYLQLMTVPHLQALGNRTLEIAEISKSLKALAKELNCPVVALSQLNRSLEQRTDKRPINSDLRESGSIEQDADVIMFIYRDEVYNEDSEYKGSAEIIIGKQRNGPIGKVRLATRLHLSKFDDYAHVGGYDNY